MKDIKFYAVEYSAYLILFNVVVILELTRVNLVVKILCILLTIQSSFSLILRPAEDDRQ